jgi:hypothetical protein
MSTQPPATPPIDAVVPTPQGWSEEVEWAEFNVPAELRAVPDDALPVDPRELSHD